VDFSLVSRLGVFPVVALVISIVCVLAVLWTSGRVYVNLLLDFRQTHAGYIVLINLFVYNTKVPIYRV